MEQFLGKFSANNRPALTPAETNPNVQGDNVSGQEQMAPAVQNFFSNARASNQLADLKQRKGSITNPVYESDVSISLNQIMNGISEKRRSSKQFCTPGSSAPSSLSKLLQDNNTNNHERENSKDLSTMFDQASLDGNVVKGMGTNYNQSDRVNGGKARKSNTNVSAGRLTTMNKKTMKMGRDGRKAAGNTYLQFSKVDMLNTPQSKSSCIEDCDADKAMNISYGKPSELCCQYSLDNKERIRTQEIKGTIDPSISIASNNSVVEVNNDKLVVSEGPSSHSGDNLAAGNVENGASSVNSGVCRQPNNLVDIRQNNDVGLQETKKAIIASETESICHSTLPTNENDQPGSSQSLSKVDHVVKNDVSKLATSEARALNSIEKIEDLASVCEAISIDSKLAKRDEIEAASQNEGNVKGFEDETDGKSLSKTAKYSVDEILVDIQNMSNNQMQSLENSAIHCTSTDKMNANKFENANPESKPVSIDNVTGSVITTNVLCTTDVCVEKNKESIAYVSNCSSNERSKMSECLPDYEDSVVNDGTLNNNQSQVVVVSNVGSTIMQGSDKVANMNTAPTDSPIVTNFPNRTLGDSLFMSDRYDSTLIKEAAEYKPKFVGEMMVPGEKMYAPVDVAGSKTYVYATSQATNSVAVFKSKNHKFVGVLKLPERKPFNSPHNVIFVPPYCSSQLVMSALRNFEELPVNQSGKKTKEVLAAGCVVVLDNNGFHIFTEEGEFVTTLLQGEGQNFRGLSLYYQNSLECANNLKPILHLLTININFNKDPEYAHLTSIDMEKAMSSGGKFGINLSLARILPTHTTMGLMDQKHKCRFLASGVTKNSSSPADMTFGPSVNDLEDKEKSIGTTMAYITGLASKQIYSVNLNTKESSTMKLTQRSEKMINSTFAADQTLNINGTGNVTFVPQDPNTTFASFHLRSPAGIQLDDKGNILVADRNNNEVYAFSPSGVLIKEILKSDKSIEETMTERQADTQFQPVGIFFDEDHRDLYICSNKNKKVLHCHL